MSESHPLRGPVSEILFRHDVGGAFDAQEALDEIEALLFGHYGQPREGSFEDGRRHGLQESIAHVTRAARDGQRTFSLGPESAAHLQERILRYLHTTLAQTYVAPSPEGQMPAAPLEEDAYDPLTAALDEAAFWRSRNDSTVTSVRTDTIFDLQNLMRAYARESQQHRRPISAEFEHFQRKVRDWLQASIATDRREAVQRAESYVAEPWTTPTTWNSAREALLDVKSWLSPAGLSGPFAWLHRRSVERVLKEILARFDEVEHHTTKSAEYEAQMTLRAAKEQP